jgi:ATP-dependent helicase HrpB
MGLRPRVELPVDGVLPELLALLRSGSSVVLEAPPGAGKTTRVPPALLEVVRGEVVVLEPRRIAARLSARRVAEEMGEEVGGLAGYQVRFEEKVSARTRLRFVTEGILTRRMLRDPMLKGVDAVVLDEFHERHLDSDLALALLKRLQRARVGNGAPELKVVVMSATLDAGPIAAFLECPVLRTEGRRYPLTVRHEAYSAEALAVQVRKALSGLLGDEPAGNVLVFVPGVAEIRRVMRECGEVARGAGMVVLPLYGSLTAAEQDLAVRADVGPTARRKLIVATNVAESSVTVEGVTAVIDSGLARFAGHSAWTGMQTLTVGRISKASATQRAGRAGRTAPGTVVRLYPEEDFQLRREQDLPEIVRSDLSGLVLGLRAMGMEAAGMEWLDAPPAEALAAAEELLDRLGATGAMAQELARYPLPPRLARVVVEALRRGVGQDGCRAAALLAAESGFGTGAGAKADLLEAMDGALDENVRRSVEQLLRVAQPPRPAKHDDEALLMSVLAGFPDHVARRRAGNLLALATGVSAELADGLGRSEFLVALDAEDRDDKAMPLVRLTSRVEPEWLLEMFPERVVEDVRVVWNRAAERVEQVSSLLYDQLVLEERRGPAEADAAASLLADKALEAGLALFVEREAMEGLLARLSFAGVATPEVDAAFREMCAGMSSFAELRAAAPSLLPMLEARAGRLEELAPATIKLRGGRVVRVHYELGKPPWVASRMQDFFGMRETPRVGRERVAVVVHLLAPNGRAVQTTSDLAGFWERLYPTVRRELMRRYPRHAWPEDPRG